MGRARGFTLVEMLVSLAVVSLIALLVTTQIRTETIALRRTTVLNDALDHTIILGTTPSRLLGSAYPLTVESGRDQTVIFEGDADRVVFVTLAHAPPIDPGLSVYALSIGQVEGQSVLRIARSRLEAYLETGDPEGDGLISEVTTLPDGARFVYADPSAGLGASDPWVDAWADIPFLPSGVALCVSCRGDEVPILAAAFPPRTPVCLNTDDQSFCSLEAAR